MDEFEVPVVRDWFTPAFAAWRRFVYGGRGGLLVFGGWLIFIAIALTAAKAAVFWGAAFAMLLLWMLTAVIDVATYRWRKRAADERKRVARQPWAA